MLMKNLGRSKWRGVRGWALAVILILGSLGGSYAAEKAVAPPSPAPTSGESDIIFNGKLSCSLRRQVDLPFKGIITSLRVHSGQLVKAGEILATYKLAPESLMVIQQRLSPPQIPEMETKLAEVDRGLVPLKSKQRELTQLVQKQLAPAQSLAQSNREVQFAEKQKTTLQEKLKNDRELAQQDREVLNRLLGSSVKFGQVPREVALKAPISGNIIWVNPEVRVNAELPPLPAAFQVGVMNPMLVRGQAFEIEALQIKVGDRAEVTLDSLPGRKFQAEVSRISWSPIASGTPSIDQPAYYEVELTIPNPDLALKEGLKARIVLHKSK
ncbi:MAG: efflux RND transporter periplasmic adaptor subunit [Desulfobaccales bacterium]